MSTHQWRRWRLAAAITADNAAAAAIGAAGVPVNEDAAALAAAAIFLGVDSVAAAPDAHRRAGHLHRTGRVLHALPLGHRRHHRVHSHVPASLVWSRLPTHVAAAAAAAAAAAVAAGAAARSASTTRRSIDCSSSPLDSVYDVA